MADLPVSAPCSSPTKQQKAIEMHLKNKQNTEVLWKDLPAVITRTIKQSNGISSEHYITYSRGRYLGKGGCARVYELQDTSTGITYAGKIILKQTLTRRSKFKLLTEIQIHRSIDHPSVVSYVDYFEDNRFVFILLELCSNRSMMKLIRYRKRLSEDEIRYYLRDIFKGLEHLKSHRIIHRDLKLGNLLLDSNMKVKIADFGLAAKLTRSNERKKTICGTPNYIAPEILKGKEQGHSFEVDIWSMGVITYTLLVGRPPFESKDFKVTYQRITENIYSFPDDIELSVNAKNFIREMLHPDASCRPTASEVLDHPFFSGNMIPNSVPISSMRFSPHPRSDETRTSELFWEESTIPTTSDSRPFVFAGNKKATKTPLSPTTLNTIVQSPKITTKRRRHKVSSLYPTQGAENSSSSVVQSPSMVHAKFATKPVTLETEMQLELILNSLNDVVGRKDSDNVPTGVSELSTHTKEHLHVFRWVDELKRVGIGFQLSNAVTCVYFNDDTKVSFDPSSHYFHYWEPRVDEETQMVCLNEDYERIYHLTCVPDELRKKTEILLHFRHYFLYGKNTGCSDEMRADMSRKVISDEAKVPSCEFVQRFIRTKHAMTFKLSNGSVQTNFFDHTKLITHTQDNLIVFISSKAQSRFFAMDGFDHADKLVSSRVRYVRDTVATMVRIRHHVPSSRASPPKSEPSAKRKKIA